MAVENNAARRLTTLSNRNDDDDDDDNEKKDKSSMSPYEQLNYLSSAWPNKNFVCFLEVARLWWCSLAWSS
jgi:hypothetical protein